MSRVTKRSTVRVSAEMAVRIICNFGPVEVERLDTGEVLIRRRFCQNGCEQLQRWIAPPLTKTLCPRS